MLRENLSSAKGQLSRLINSALAGEDVVICKGGVPAVRLVPVRPVSGEDPCRVIPELSIATAGAEALEPLGDQAWGGLTE